MTRTTRARRDKGPSAPVTSGYTILHFAMWLPPQGSQQAFPEEARYLQSRPASAGVRRGNTARTAPPAGARLAKPTSSRSALTHDAPRGPTAKPPWKPTCHIDREGSTSALMPGSRPRIFDPHPLINEHAEPFATLFWIEPIPSQEPINGLNQLQNSWLQCVQNQALSWSSPTPLKWNESSNLIFPAP